MAKEKHAVCCLILVLCLPAYAADPDTPSPHTSAVLVAGQSNPGAPQDPITTEHVSKPDDLAPCERTLTAAAIYRVSQDRAGNESLRFDWSEIKADLIAEGWSEGDIAVQQAEEDLRTSLISELIEEALRVAMLSLGVQKHMLGQTVTYIQARALPEEEVDAILHRTAEILKKYRLPNISSENLERIESIRKKYCMSIATYRTLSRAVNATDAISQERLRLALLGTLLKSDRAFAERLGSPGYFKMRASQKLASGFNLDQKRLPAASNANDIHKQPASVKLQLHRIFGAYGSAQLDSQKKGALLIALFNLIWSVPEKGVSPEASLATSDIDTILLLIPIGTKLFHHNFNYPKELLGDQHKGADIVGNAPSELVILVTSLRKITVRDTKDIAALQRRFLNKIRSSLMRHKLPLGIQTTVYFRVEAEFTRIARLPLVNPDRSE